MQNYGKGTLDDMRTILANAFSTAIVFIMCLFPVLARTEA